jgi:phage shock protein A
MEEKIDQSERQIRASAEIDEEMSGDRLANDFKRLEKTTGSLSADAKLLALKQKMGMLPSGASPTRAQLGAGVEETVSADVEDVPGDRKKAT